MNAKERLDPAWRMQIVRSLCAVREPVRNVSELRRVEERRRSDLTFNARLGWRDKSAAIGLGARGWVMRVLRLLRIAPVIRFAQSIEHFKDSRAIRPYFTSISARPLTAAAGRNSASPSRLSRDAPPLRGYGLDQPALLQQGLAKRSWLKMSEPLLGQGGDAMKFWFKLTSAEIVEWQRGSRERIERPMFLLASLRRLPSPSVR